MFTFPVLAFCLLKENEETWDDDDTAVNKITTEGEMHDNEENRTRSTT